MVCLGCGRIIEFECPLTEGIKARVGKEEGFEVIEAEVLLAGYCPDCRQHLINNKTDTEPKRQTAEMG